MSFDTRNHRLASSHPDKMAAPPPASAPAPAQPPLILPDTSFAEGVPQHVKRCRKSFATQAWPIPDRPKPGRKPKQKNLQEKPGPSIPHQPQFSASCIGAGLEAAPKSISRSVEPSAATCVEPTPNPKEQATFAPPDGLQQAYIDSLEEKIETLQKHSTDQVNYYKTLSVQSASKATKLQQENDVLQAQMNVLRAEVLRLRKRISYLLKKATDGAPIVIEDDSVNREAKVRKQSTGEGDGGSLAALPDNPAAKKPRQCLVPLNPEDLNYAAASPSSEGPKNPSSAPSIREDPKNAPMPATSQTLILDKPLAGPCMDENTRNPGLRQPSMTKRIPDFTSNDIDCGLCTSELDCVCRHVGLKPPLESINISERDIGDRLAVPIFRRPHSSTKSVWAVTIEHESASPSEATPEVETETVRECSGNPKDCPACSDDPFGQAFCTALNYASNSRQPDSSLRPIMLQKQQSDPVVDAYMTIPCCGQPELCGSQGCYDAAPAEPSEPKVSCSEAWRQLKAHPNIGLANLQLLADVVARKSSSPIVSSPFPTSESEAKLVASDDRSYSPRAQAEDWSSGPHVTLATVFENMNNRLDGRDNGSQYGELESQSGSSSRGQAIKFVEKYSLDEALRMLDRSRP